MTPVDETLLAPPPKRRRVQWLTLLALSLLAIAIGFRIATSRAGQRDFYGVRLGQSANDTRDRFQPNAPGTWTLTQEPEPVFRWAAQSKDAAVRTATFEFHDGMLVAARYDLAHATEAASGPPLEVLPATLIARDPQPDDRVQLTVISRTCPQHQDEVKRLLARAASGG
jgi:hypothetical protein